MLKPAHFAFHIEHCIVRPLCVADLPGLTGLYTDPRTQQFVGQLLTETAAIARLQACLRANQQSPLQQVYLAVENQRQQLAGMAAGFCFAARPRLAGTRHHVIAGIAGTRPC